MNERITLSPSLDDHINNRGASSSSTYAESLKKQLGKDHVSSESPATKEDVEEVLDFFNTGLQQQSSEYRKDLKKLRGTTNRKIKELEKDIQGSKARVIETLGIFVALFTFISLDFQLLKEVTYFEVSISLILIAGGLLILFLLIMKVLSNPQHIIQSPWMISIFVVLLVLAVAILSCGIYYLEKGLGNINKQEELPINEKNKQEETSYIESSYL